MSERHALANGANNRIAALDGLRGIAVSWVIISHANMSFGPLPGWKLIASGWMGVDIFFALSGFLITGILLETRGSTRYFKNFYARRALRIFPLYWGYLTLALFALPSTTLGRLAQLEHQSWHAISALYLYYYNTTTCGPRLPAMSRGSITSGLCASKNSSTCYGR
jgi:peptidoglycan/LPS O-acetylase OafA/YrhL